MKPLQIKVADSIHQDLKALSEKDCTTVSHIVRQSIKLNLALRSLADGHCYEVSIKTLDQNKNLVIIM